MTARATTLPPELAGLLQERARTFAFASRLLPSDTRQDVVTLYALFRHLDDLADEPSGLTTDEIAERYAAWRSWFLGGDPPEADRALALAYGDLAARYAIPPEYALGMVDGLGSDLEPRRRVQNFDELRLYCLRVAGTVGLAMCHILQCTSPAALNAATDLGIAMQLTNVLRDIGGDLERDRIYLPADEMARFGYSGDRLFALYRERGQPDADFRNLMRFQIRRARAYYQRGLAGVWLLQPEVRTGILVAGRLYRAILDVVEQRQYDVLRRRAFTTRRRKLREAATSLVIARLWGREPAEPDVSEHIPAEPEGGLLAQLGLPPLPHATG